MLNPGNAKWTLQGFGMLRLHLNDELRLNVWDSRFKVPGVSAIHTHPWDFESLIVVGRLYNTRYVETNEGTPYMTSELKPGTGGGLIGKPREVLLLNRDTEVYTAGMTYEQKAYEIHDSSPEDGTVTYNRRTRVGEDVASVYWNTQNWVSAEPRLATQEEVFDILDHSFKTWSW